MEPLREENVSFVYFGGFKDDGQVFPLAFNKPGVEVKYLNVLLSDGGVINFEGDFPSCLSAVAFLDGRALIPEELREAMLAKARNYDGAASP